MESAAVVGRRLRVVRELYSAPNGCRVFRVSDVHAPHQPEYALKQVSFGSPEGPRAVMHEAGVFSSLRHDCILRHVASWTSDADVAKLDDDARVLAEGLERSIDAIRDAWGELPEKQRALVAKTFGEGAWPPVANAVIRRWFSTDNSGSSRRHLDDDDDDVIRSGSNETGLHETRLDEERVNALVGAEGAAQALGLVPPPPHVGPVESAAYERDRAERAGYVAAVLAAGALADSAKWGAKVEEAAGHRSEREATETVGGDWSADEVAELETASKQLFPLGAVNRWDAVAAHMAEKGKSRTAMDCLVKGRTLA